MIFNRKFSMPNSETFSMPPVRELLQRYATPQSMDPFARNNKWASVTNDLDPSTTAEYHMDAELFCKSMGGNQYDLVLFDPPYSPRQISECYKGIGLKVGMRETQNASLYKRVRDAFDPLVSQEGIVISFGWHSNGMGVGRGYEPVEILLIQHGGAHNDTICLVERKVRRLL